MIKKENIKEIVCNEIQGTDLVLVDIQVSSSNNIKIVLDSIKGVNIDECVKINKLIENNFDRELEDYQLEISSYGISQPLIIPLHFLKNLNKEVEINLKGGGLQRGILKNYKLSEDNETIEFVEISYIKKIKEEGKKKKTEVEEIIKVQNNDIQRIKLVPVY